MQFLMLNPNLMLFSHVEIVQLEKIEKTVRKSLFIAWMGHLARARKVLVHAQISNIFCSLDSPQFPLSTYVRNFLGPSSSE